MSYDAVACADPTSKSREGVGSPRGVHLVGRIRWRAIPIGRRPIRSTAAEISRARILWLPRAVTPRLISHVLLAATERQVDRPPLCSATTCLQERERVPSHGARVHLRHRGVRGRAQDPVPRCQARPRQCRLRRRQARAAPRARRRGQEVLDPGREERPRDHQPAVARRLAPRRLRFRPSWPGQGPGVPQVVPRGGADPRAVGDGGRAGHLRGAGVERRPVVRGRGRPGRHRALLLRVASGHAAAADGVGGVEAVGGLLQPGLAVRGVGHAVVAHRRELHQLHRRPGLPGRQVLRPAQPRRHHQRRFLHPRRGEAREAQAGRDQARPPRHARHAHLLLRGRPGQDAARRPRLMSLFTRVYQYAATVETSRLRFRSTASDGSAGGQRRSGSNVSVLFTLVVCVKL